MATPNLIVTVTDPGFEDRGEELSQEIYPSMVRDATLCDVVAQGLLFEHGYLPGVQYEWRIARADLANT